MKKLAFCVALLTMLLQCGCAEIKKYAYVDGTYTKESEMADIHGLTHKVTIDVVDNKILNVSLSSADTKSGNTILDDNFLAQLELLEQNIIEYNSLDNITLNEDGTTGAITNLTINIKAYYDLVNTVLTTAKID